MNRKQELNILTTSFLRANCNDSSCVIKMCVTIVSRMSRETKFFLGKNIVVRVSLKEFVSETDNNQ